MSTDPTGGLGQVSPTMMSSNSTLLDALKMLASENVDSALVMDHGEVVGVFSLRRLPDLVRGQRFPRGADQIEGWVTTPEFFHPDQPLEFLIKRLMRTGVVLLGTPGDVTGVLTLRSVADFAHPFLVIRDIEQTLREAIALLVPADDRGPVFAEVLGPTYGSRPPPNAVDRLTIGDYATLLSNPRVAARFRPIFGGSAGERLGRIGDLRNSLFHFRDGLRPSEIEFLEDQRSWFLARLDRIHAQRIEPRE